MFSISDRERIQADLVAHAKDNGSIAGAAFVGSSATGDQDAWSDIDLMLQLAPNAIEADIVDAWTDRLYTRYHVVHHLDVRASNGVLYRVFLTADSLQMDISFWPYEEFRANGERFQLIFGTPAKPTRPGDPDVNTLIGETWLFAIHVRSAIARNEPWYAVSLMDTMLNRIMMLASIHHGFNPHQRREVDKLPVKFLDKLKTTRAMSLDDAELRRAFATMMHIFQAEITAHNQSLAESLAPALNAMINPERHAQ